ncbi:membrane cofactor protein [Protobothrops mucrosquamatus]|uniref:membrane cofactor protein n=1 Tax=Protobothrops mucrosquamatus TaxID=103944 RepID=UPI0010FAE5E7|nr:membrane cofactor protein [Protobothrops mucrosquamatus]
MALSPCSNGVPIVVLFLLFLASTVLCDCLTPTLPPHSRLRGSEDLKDSYPPGTVLRLVCIPGHEFIPGSRPLMTCSPEGTWTKIPELCQGKRCPVPHLENGRIVTSDDLRLGETVTLACEVGFRMIGESILRCILRGGEVRWHRDIPYCERIPCVRPPTISNGRYDADPTDEYSVGMAVVYRCNADFSLIGRSTINCVVAADGKNGEWSSPPPECKKVNCAKPSIRNGRLVSLYRPTYTYGDSVSFECNPGYTLVGATVVKCAADNTWKPPPPRCDEGVATTKPTRPPPPVPPVPPPVPHPPPVPPTILPTLVPPKEDETTFIPMYPTQSATIPTPESGSGSGKIVGIVFGIIFALIVLAASIFAAVKWWNQWKANAPDNSQVASEKEKTTGDQRPQKLRSKTSGNIQHFSSLE